MSTALDAQKLNHEALAWTYATKESEKARIAMALAPHLTGHDLAICTAFGITPVAYLLAKHTASNREAPETAPVALTGAMASAAAVAREDAYYGTLKDAGTLAKQATDYVEQQRAAGIVVTHAQAVRAVSK